MSSVLYQNKLPVWHNQIKQFIGLEKKYILEIGCGYGYFTNPLTYENCYSYFVGIDPNKESIAYMKNKKVPYSTFIDCTLQNFQSPIKFDLIVFGRSFHELTKISFEEALLKSKSILNTHGKILIIEECIESPYFQILTSIKDNEAIFEVEKIIRAKEFIKKIPPSQIEHLHHDLNFNNIDHFCDITSCNRLPVMNSLVKNNIPLNKNFILEETLSMYLI